MVDDIQGRINRIRTLSDSSRSDVSVHSASEGSQLSTDCDVRESFPVPRSRKQNIRELREEIEDDPELYGIRRSNRSRKEPFRFEAQVPKTVGRGRRFIRHRSGSSSDHSSDFSSENRWSKWNRRDRSVRTRGNRVNYKSAFAAVSSEESDEDTENIARSVQTKTNGNIYPKRESCEPDDSSTQDGTVEDIQFGLGFDDEEEADVIEEILTHAVRRKGAVGNQTTMYNAKLENDLNQGFDPTQEEGELHFLIKWRNWSHIHSTWETEGSLLSPDRGTPVHGMKKLKIYQAMLREKEEFMRCAELDELDTIAYEEERSEQILADKMEVERIVSHSRDTETNSFDYLVKWLRLEYHYCSWESGRVIKALFPSAVCEYEARCRSAERGNRHCEALHTRPRFSPLTQQPSYLGNSDSFKLRDYQLEGINWIARAWSRNVSVILADEMGLGKTIQTIGFLSYLFNEQKIHGPFLIVVPLSTASSWQKELQSWAPQLNTIIYTGDHMSRQLLREYEWCVGGATGIKRQQALKFHVCVTTYEILLKDKSWLSQVPWSFLGVDEAHRLKNDASQLYKTLKLFDANTRLLITGTPLQNTMRELWALLHFIMPDKFPSWDEFEELSRVNADDPTSNMSGEVFHHLHKVLRPFLLRRVKKDVESSLPEKIEQILRVDMTLEQANIYRLILARNYDGLLKVTRGHRTSFINIVMELKKCCNHAHLIAPPSENEKLMFTRERYLDSLIKGSGKLTLLDKLLQRLKSRGNRVLIFSQMVRMLDLIADYLSLRGWGFQRLDGSVRGAIRKQALDHFNADGSTDFCFLLSTRAGGLGINLATADTVIIFDSDWNPQNDLQAQARAHRIGQTKQVSVYRLVTQESVEEKIIESATRKMVLDHLVIQRMDSSENKTGVRKDVAKGQLLSEILRYGAEGLFSQSEENRVELEVDIDDILNRAETRDADSANRDNPANTLLSSFKVATFDPVDEEPHSISGASKTWDEIIPSAYRDNLKAEEAQKTLIDLELGPRRRTQVKAFQAGLDSVPSSDESSGENDNKTSCLNEKEIRSLVRAIKRFARPLERIDAIAADAELPHKTESEIKDLVCVILDGCRSVMKTCPTDDTKSSGKGPIFQYGRVSISARPLLQNLEFLETLHQILPTASKESRLTFELPIFPKMVAWSCPWDVSDDVHLLAGVYEHGYDNWEAIKLDADLGLGSKLLPVSPSERPQASHIRSRVDYLIRMLAKESQKAQNSTPVPGSKRHAPSSNSTKPKHKQPSTYGRSKPTRLTNTERSSNSSKPKSAEFVDTDDSSSDSDDPNEEPVTIISAKRPKTDATPPAKKKSHSVKLKKNKRKDLVAVNDSQRSESNNVAIPLTEKEDDFQKMRGPLFLKCKEKLIPIKKHLKQLEYLEDLPGKDLKKFSNVILLIGDHIHSVVESEDDRKERHHWKSCLWDFVKLFSQKSTEELRHVYRHAAKRRLKDRLKDHKLPSPKDSSDQTNPPTNEDDRSRYRPSRDSSHSGYYHREKYNNRERNDARFDNAFNRPPSFYDQSQNYSKHPNRSSRQHHSFVDYPRSDYNNNNQFQSIKHRASVEPCDSIDTMRSSHQAVVFSTSPVNAQQSTSVRSPDRSTFRDPRMSARR